MSKYIVSGGKRLFGEITMQGAKNAALPILAGSLLSGGRCIIHNCPNISDVNVTIDILRHLGCKADFDGGTVTVDASGMNKYDIPQNLMHKMRSSVVFLGAILGKMQTAQCSYPGGCELGNRPIDLHLKAFREMGAQVTDENGFISCRLAGFKPSKIMLTIPSVGATENIMLLACTKKGKTVIVNAAREPEIVDLQNFLNAMGAKISGAGKGVIEIEGTDKLRGCEYSVIPDRIATATMLLLCMSARGKIKINSVNMSHIDSVVSVMRECGAIITSDGGSAVIECGERPHANELVIQTMPYPGFPTDAQSQFMAMLATACGTSVIRETIFDNRFNTAFELQKMGASITVSDRIVIVRGVRQLHGAQVTAPDLRGGAALVIAALGAQGETEIENVPYIDRGYECFDKWIEQLGGSLKRTL